MAPNAVLFPDYGPPPPPKPARTRDRPPDFVSADDVLALGPQRPRRRLTIDEQSPPRRRHSSEHHSGKHGHRAHHHRKHRSEHRAEHRAEHRSAHRSEHRSRSRSHHRSEHRTHESRPHSSNRSKPQTGHPASANVHQRDLRQLAIVQHHLAGRPAPHRVDSVGLGGKPSWLAKLSASARGLARECLSSFQAGSAAVAEDVHRPFASRTGTAAVRRHGSAPVPARPSAPYISSQPRNIDGDTPPPPPPPKASWGVGPGQDAQYQVYVTTPDPKRPCTPWPRICAVAAGPDADQNDAALQLPRALQEVHQPQHGVHRARAASSEGANAQKCLTGAPEDTREPQCHYCLRAVETGQPLCCTCRSLGFTSTPSAGSDHPLHPDNILQLRTRLAALAANEACGDSPPTQRSPHGSASGGSGRRSGPRGATPHSTGGSIRATSVRDLVPPRTGIYARTTPPQFRTPLNSSGNPASAACPPRRRPSTKGGTGRERSPADAGTTCIRPVARPALARGAFHDDVAAAGSPPSPVAPLRRTDTPGSPGSPVAPRPLCVRRAAPSLHLQTPGTHTSMRATLSGGTPPASPSPSPPLLSSRRRAPTPSAWHAAPSGSVSPSSLSDSDVSYPSPPYATGRSPWSPVSTVGATTKPTGVIAGMDVDSPTSVYSRATRCVSPVDWAAPQEEMAALEALLRWGRGEGWDRAMGSVLGRG